VIAIVIGIPMMVYGFRAMARSRIRIGSRREVRGLAAVLIGFFLFMPLPASVGYGIVSAQEAAAGGVMPYVWWEENKEELAFVELGVYVVCGLLAAILTIAFARPIGVHLDEHVRRFAGEASCLDKERS
jgi:hypothetical protein